MKLLSVWIRLCLFGLAWLAGLAWASSCNLLKDDPALAPKHDPTVVIQSFSYKPGGPIHSGDRLTFTAVLNKPARGAVLKAIVKKSKAVAIELNDSGFGADGIEGDGSYSGETFWSPELGTGSSLSVWVELKWKDGAPGQRLAGPSLTVLPKGWN